MKIAMYYEKITNDMVKCFLCPHGCELAPEETGICMARKNIGGELYSLNYGKVTALALDPIEKKPLRRFHPESTILSIGSFGCNLKCSYCQNSAISQSEAESEDVTPKIIVDGALKSVEKGNIGIAYTYNEPSIWYEFVHDCAILAHQHGLKNVLVTNGYINREPMEKLLPLIDAMNIDLKSVRNKFYNEMCQGQVDYVKETIALCAETCHVEVTTLIIPGQNDSEDEIEELAHWIASISMDIPLHLSRYHPDYKMQQPEQISQEKLENLANIAKRSLSYVYLGNV